MAKLVMLCGVPGSGKSYFSSLLSSQKKDHVYIVSSDALRLLIGGSQQDFTHEKMMWDMYYELARTYSKDEDGIVILDSTNKSSKYRIENCLGLKKYFNEFDLVSFHIDPEVVRKQNLEREWPIPSEALEEFIRDFELPNKSDYEFFDKVFVIEDKNFQKIIDQIK